MLAWRFQNGKAKIYRVAVKIKHFKTFSDRQSASTYCADVHLSTKQTILNVDRPLPEYKMKTRRYNIKYWKWLISRRLFGEWITKRFNWLGTKAFIDDMHINQILKRVTPLPERNFGRSIFDPEDFRRNDKILKYSIKRFSPFLYRPTGKQKKRRVFLLTRRLAENLIVKCRISLRVMVQT